MQKAAKATLLDHFYNNLEQQDWLEGLDLYQGGRVHNLQTYEGLITGRVVAANQAEVRMKIMPGNRSIQWIECTCRKNRQFGQYCEHIAAFMIHVDRERADLLGGLDPAIALKPPVPPKKPRQVAGPTPQTPAAPAKHGKVHEGATQTILEHLQGAIQSVSLVAHGPTLRVRIEIKPGHVTHYDLNLDAGAKFLESHPKRIGFSGELQNLSLFTNAVELGCRIYQPEPERIIAERVVALRLGHSGAGKKALRADDFKRLSLSHEIGSYRRALPGAAETKPDTWLFVPMKSAAKYLGESYFFLPGFGYFPVTVSTTKSAWGELPLNKVFKDDAAAELVYSGYQDYLSSGPIYLDQSLHNPKIIEAENLSEIMILDQAGQGDGWFRLDPRYGTGKSAVSMVELLKQWTKKKRRFVRSDDGWMKIPDFVTQHHWELDTAGDALKVDAVGLLRLKAAVGDFDQFVGSRRLLDQVRNKLEFVPESTESVPHTASMNLREYQETGLRWLWWLYRNGLHGLLADEMGLGKTHQAMALLSAIRLEKPDAKFLIICPTTVLDHWLDKIEQYAPDLKPIKYHGPRRGAALSELRNQHQTLITSYGVMLRDTKHLLDRYWDALILDEAHFVKNNDTATYQAACRIRSQIRVCLTGTPMENSLTELKNLFDFLVPGYLGSDDYFKRVFLAPMQDNGSPETTLTLQKLIHPFKMRRTKSQVLKDLPAKVEDLRHCELSDEQVRLYREVLELKARPLIEQLRDESTPIPFLHVFATLTMLKQICDHPALLSEAPNYKKHESGKFDLLQELLEEALGSGHKIVIFSQYVSMINLITSYLTDCGIEHVTLTGQSRNRGDIIKRFQTNPDIKIFCGSLLAGGIGIDLTAASVVIHYDRWWNATKESQATDRVHRIGQNKNVQVLKLITRGTLEEKIDRMIAAKRALFEKFLDRDEEIFRTLSRHELVSLLE